MFDSRGRSFAFGKLSPQSNNAIHARAQLGLDPVLFYATCFRPWPALEFRQFLHLVLFIARAPALSAISDILVVQLPFLITVIVDLTTNMLVAIRVKAFPFRLG